MKEVLSIAALMVGFLAIVAYDASSGESFPFHQSKTITVTMPSTVP